VKLSVENVEDKLKGVWRQAGCGSWDTLQDFGSLALVRASPKPRPNAKPPPRWAKVGGLRADNDEMRLEIIYLYF